MTGISNREFDVLVAAYLDQTLDEPQMRQLAALLSEDPDRVKRLAVMAQVDHLIADEVAYGEQARAFGGVVGRPSDAFRSSGALAQLAGLEAMSEDTVQLIDRTADRKKRISQGAAGRVMRKLVTSPAFHTAVAAVLIVAATAYFLWPEAPDESQPAVATPNGQAEPDRLYVAGAYNAAWADGETRDHREGLGPGTYTLSRGHARLVYPGGAEVVLEAPIRVTVDDRPRIRLHEGRLVGICHTPESRGFTVQTDHTRIVDLGTEFGVSVTDEQTDVAVFVGKVEMTTNRGASQRIEQNQTASLLTRDGLSRLSLEDGVATEFTRRLPRPSIVTAARLNLEGFEVKVVAQGVFEDARLFTDRTHEINGLDASGIPPALLAGDLIQMPSNARPNLTKGTAGLELELELSRPADIYVLMPDMIENPAWLAQDYERTGMRVGHDRGEGFDGETPGVGPGNSIDNDMVVWRRKQPAVGTVTATYGINFAMYAVVAVPREEGGTRTPQ